MKDKKESEDIYETSSGNMISGIYFPKFYTVTFSFAYMYTLYFETNPEGYRYQ
jgi:hypothetical protein